MVVSSHAFPPWYLKLGMCWNLRNANANELIWYLWASECLRFPSSVSYKALYSLLSSSRWASIPPSLLDAITFLPSLFTKLPFPCKCGMLALGPARVETPGLESSPSTDSSFPPPLSVPLSAFAPLSLKFSNSLDLQTWTFNWSQELKSWSQDLKVFWMSGGCGLLWLCCQGQGYHTQHYRWNCLFSIMRTQDNHVKKYSLVQFTCKGKPPVHRAPLPCGSVAGACRKIGFHKPGGRDIGSGSNQ